MTTARKRVADAALKIITANPTGIWVEQWLTEKSEAEREEV
ncbi:hypothetical protein [Lysobacter silvisoli]|nr:hypothetical protein [Lysobacter silvisoli]